MQAASNLTIKESSASYTELESRKDVETKSRWLIIL